MKPSPPANMNMLQTLSRISSCCVCAAALAANSASAARTWSVYETARDNGHRLSEIAAAAAAPDVASATADPAETITCLPDARRQEIVGFGGALTESSAWVLAQLPADKRNEVIRHYYDPHDGIRYNLARTHINSCDFSLRIWSLDDTPGDTQLRDFSLAPMREWVLPLIRDARAIAGANRFQLLASPWSPPAWMKTNGEMPHGGSLKPEYRDTWARFIVKFIDAMQREEHIPVWAITVQNEPEAVQIWESCIYTPEEERDFVRDHLGPALAHSPHRDVRILGWDHNRDRIEARAAAMLGDREAARYLWGLGMHWYVSEDYAAPSRVHAQFPDKHILFTEGCLEKGAKLGEWDRGERYATSIIQDFRNWIVGWIDWNIVLDLQGGPNHVQNFCDAPILVDVKTGGVFFQNSFYYIGHFSRFVARGAHRIDSHGGPAGLDSVAFVNPDGALVFVVMNRTDAPLEFALAAGGAPRKCQIPAHAIQTYVGANS